MPISSPPEVHQSLVGALYNKCFDFSAVDDYVSPKDTGIKRVAKIGAGFIVHPLFALALAVETLVRTALLMLTFLIFIPLKCFMPEAEITKKFGKYVCGPLVASTIGNTVFTFLAAVTPALNCAGMGGNFTEMGRFTTVFFKMGDKSGESQSSTA